MSEPCDLRININGQQTFVLSERILSKYSGKLRKIIKQEKRRTQIRTSGLEIDDFPGGPQGFELVLRFCYNRGSISLSASNVSLLHCCAVFLEMTEKPSRNNLLHQTEAFLETVFYWSWNDLLTCLRNYEPFHCYADSCGLIQKLVCSLLAKIAQNTDVVNSLPSSSSSPESAHSFLSSPVASSSSSSRKAWSWWFHDMTTLGPKTIENFLKSLGCYGTDNSNLILTRFLLHYLKRTLHTKSKKINYVATDYTGLVDTAVHGVVLMGKTSFSCRGLFSVLRIASKFELSREKRSGLERLIGEHLDQATLDDLLVLGAGNSNKGFYDVKFVIRLIRLFVHYNDDMSFDKLKKVADLIDMYLGEIGPDQNLKASKFLGVAESLPDCARDSYDQVYRAVDSFLESHPSLSLEERSRLCRCINYSKLSLEACKDLAKNPKIPPNVAVRALSSQHSNLQTVEIVKKKTKKNEDDYYDNDGGDSDLRSRNSSRCYHQSSKNHQEDEYGLVLYENDDERCDRNLDTKEKEDLKTNLEMMQWRVVELEKACREMKGQMSKLAPTQRSRPPLTRLC